METKKLILGLLALSLIGWGIGVSLLKFYDCGSLTCDDIVARLLALYYGMPALALVFSLLFFLPSAFPVWKKFAVWFLPLATILFMAYQDPRGWNDLFFPYREELYRWVSAAYVVISVIIIALAARGRRSLS